MLERIQPAVLAAATLAWAPALALAQPAAVPRTDAEREAFLLEAEIAHTRSAPGGITLSTRATLRLAGYEHDAHIQTIDEYKSTANLSSGMELDFRDSWRNNVAAYRLDRLLGIGMVPVTVVRRDPVRHKLAAFTWWVDNVQMSERERYEKKIKSPNVAAWNRQIYVVRIFDELIYNVDRNLGNLLIDDDWRIWMIDHTRGFKIFKTLKMEKQLGTSCARDLLPALRRLDKATLESVMEGLLSGYQIDALLSRRDCIVRYYEGKIASLGEGAVLYERPRPDKWPDER